MTRRVSFHPLAEQELYSARPRIALFEFFILRRQNPPALCAAPFAKGGVSDSPLRKRGDRGDLPTVSCMPVSKSAICPRVQYTLSKLAQSVYWLLQTRNGVLFTGAGEGEFFTSILWGRLCRRHSRASGNPGGVVQVGEVFPATMPSVLRVFRTFDRELVATGLRERIEINR